MKKISTILILFLFLFNCYSNDDVKDDEKLIIPTSIYGKWNWTKTTTGSAGRIILPSDSDNHFYIFDDDGTFERVSIENNVVTSLIGTFIVTDTHSIIGHQSGRNLIFIELSYSSLDVDFENCWYYNSNNIGENKQLLILKPDYKLINEANGHCHGDIYEYAKE